jgi:Tfp pilus assembly protein PilF
MNHEAVFAMGAEALEAEDLGAAERHFQSIVADLPDAHPAWNALALVAVRNGLPDIAVEHARRALQHDRRNPIYLNNLGVAYGELAQFVESEDAFRRALKVKPVYAEAMFNLGKVLHKQGRLTDSLRAYERAYAMDSEFPGVRMSLAHMCRLLAHPERAMAVLREAKGSMQRTFAPLIAECLADLEGPQRAVEWMRDVVARHPDWIASQFALGQMLLGQGHWLEGWKGYLWRLNIPGEVRRPGQVEQLPSSTAGKRIWLRGEQGLGDVLFFLRFVSQLRTRGAHMTLTCSSRLVPLLAGMEALDEIVDETSALEGSAFDHVMWLGDLPAALEADIAPSSIRLSSDPATCETMKARLLAFGPPPYLGITWRAGTDTLRRREFGNSRDVLSKEIPLAQLGEAVRAWKGTLLSLQRNPYEGELAAVAAATGSAVHDVSAFSEDLVQLAGLLSLLDEYVAVSSTNMHILAGLGKTARVLVPYPPDWRWMRSGAESAWFPGFPLYRQPQNGDWSEPLGRLRKDLFP